jgi:hypothetical protein
MSEVHAHARIVVIAVLGLLVLAQAAGAKELQPGDLLVCDASTCVPIVDPLVVDALARMDYAAPAPRQVHAPKKGKPYVFLRFENQYITGIVATDHLDRFLSYGVNMNQFGANRWYAVPPLVAAALRRLTWGMHPLHLNRSALSRSR